MDGSILVVGSGGVGCEVLKTLSGAGFQNITVVDLDTIETTNLHRQFLFGKQDCGSYKSEIACSKIKKMFNIQPTPMVGDITDKKKFPFKFFKRFGYIINSLDNNETRQYVCNLGILLDIPVVETGSAGYLGQAYLIKKGVSECYFCIERQHTEIVAVCTIRSRPKTVDHCLVWAKDILFNEVFIEKSKKIEEFYTNDIYSGEIDSRIIKSLEKMYKYTKALEESSIKELNENERNDFIYEATIIRCIEHDIEIPTKDVFLGKLNNIIPSVSSTNCIVAGAAVAILLKHIKGEKYNNQYVSAGKWIQEEKLVPKNEDCLVCNCRVENISNPETTVWGLIEAVNFTELQDIIVIWKSRILYDEDLTVNKKKRLIDLGIDSLW
eukprot:GHVP01025467.1.p1 GENE.GHVP01025467.1~~GHVP01025467.1.p1  ORF type:complete len:381 (-),score=65.75 GHVP01025467.1:185-1327(-)